MIPRKDRFDVFSPEQGRTVAKVWPKSVHSRVLGDVSPDGRQVALVGSMNEATVLEVHDMAKQAITFDTQLPLGTCSGVRFTSDGRSLFLLCETRVLKFDMASRRPEIALNHEGPIDLKMHPDLFVVDGFLIGRQFTFQQFGGGFRWQVVGSNPGSRLREHETYERIRHLTCLSLNPPGLLAIGTAEGEVHLLDSASGSHLVQIGKKQDEVIESVELSPDGKSLARFSKGTLSLLDVSQVMVGARENGLVDQIERNPGDSIFHLTSARGRFRVAFPAEPKFDAGGTVYSATTSDGSGKFEALWMEFGPNLAKRAGKEAELAEIYDTFANALAKHSPNGQLVRNEVRATDRGSERRVEWTFGNDETRTGRSRVMISGERVYAVSVTFPMDAPLDESRIEQFLASFELMHN